MFVTIRFSDKELIDQKSQAFAFFCHEGFSFETTFVQVAKEYFPALKQLMKEAQFTGKLGQTLAVVGAHDNHIQHLFFAGLGKQKGDEFDFEDYRRLLGSLVRMAEAKKITSFALELPEKKTLGRSLEYIAQQTTETLIMAAYRFDEFITQKEGRTPKIEEIILCGAKKDEKVIKEGIRTGEIIGGAVNGTRHWVDLPANIITPHELVKRAKVLAKEHALEITVFDEAQIEKLGMGGLKAVGMGSQHDAHLVIMRYNAKSKKAPTLALVGKGITFDSGGLNIKPTGYMETMKEDMAGAAAVIHTLVAISKLKPDINVVGLAPLAENMVSGNANHPGDIITFYNGKTALVGNTDAEGRLVLADALAYASKHFEPTAMIDVATLTGAVSHAIGPFFNGVLTQDEKLATYLQKIGDSSGDAVWRLPLIDRYKKMVETDVADICNDGKTKYFAGPTNGACFLSHFVGDTPWVHVDIASTAYDVPDTSYYRSGATGSGTRLLIDFVMHWQR